MSDSGEAPLKITINGQEYDPAEAQDLIETGRKTKDYETQWSTKLDSVWPEYGRSREEIKTLKSELEAYKQKAVEGNVTKQETAEAKATAQQLGVKLEDLDKAGYIKKTDLESFLEERDAKKDTIKQATDKVLAEADNLQKEIDGSDGRPKFKKAAVIAYASQYGFKDLKEAYENMWDDEIKVWKEKQIEKETRKGLQTQGAAASKDPKQPGVSKDNVDSILKEALWGGQE